MRYRVYDISYDLDGASPDLPEELFLDLDDDADPSLELADAISDKTGWSVLNLQFEEAPAPRP